MQIRIIVAPQVEKKKIQDNQIIRVLVPTLLFRIFSTNQAGLIQAW